MSEVGRKSSKRITITLQRAEKLRAGLVYHSRSNICENFPVRRFITSTMWCPKEDDSNGIFADRRVLRFDPS